MKIIQIIPTLGSGGAERFVVSLSNEISKSNNEIILCTLFDNPDDNTFNKQFIDDSVKYVPLNLKNKSPFRVIKDVCFFIFHEKPLIIHCHLGIIQYVVPILLLMPNVKVVHTLHSLTQYASGGDRWHSTLFYYLYRFGLVKPITISEECHYSFFAFYKLKNDTIIKNGCVPVRQTTRYNLVNEEVKKYKNSANTKVFIHVARFHDAKNQELLISVFNELAKDCYDFILLILGDGFDKGKGLVLKEKACSKIIFLGNKNNVGDYLLCSDAFCLTSKYEGLPISLLEAMSVGVCPICTNVGGIKNVIKDNISGYLAKDLTIKSYKDAVNRFDKGFISKDSIIKIYNDSYSIKICADNYLNFYSNGK